MSDAWKEAVAAIGHEDDGRRAPCPDCGEVGVVCEQCRRDIDRVVRHADWPVLPPYEPPL